MHVLNVVKSVLLPQVAQSRDLWANAAIKIINIHFSLRSYGPGEYGELPTYYWWTQPCKLRAFIWQFVVNNNIIIIYTTHHEKWFHYKHIFVNLLSKPCLATLVHFPPFVHQWWISSCLENLQFTGGVHQLWSQFSIHQLWSGKHPIYQFMSAS